MSVTPNSLQMSSIVHICSFYVCGNTAASHRSPMTFLFKSKGYPGLANFGPKMCKTPKNRGFTVSVKPNKLPMNQILHIRSFFMHDNTAALHRSPLAIHYKSRGSHVLPHVDQKV